MGGVLYFFIGAVVGTRATGWSDENQGYLEWFFYPKLMSYLFYLCL